MKSKMYLWNIAGIMAFLIVMLPICFAQNLNLVYDGNGNLVTGDGFYREYNSLNQLKTVRLSNTTGTILETYVYDPVEEKVLIKNVSKTDGTWKETVYYIFDEYLEVVNASGTYAFTYIEHEGQRVAEVRNDSTVLYVAPDHLGSSQVIMNSSGNVVDNLSTTPYGSILSGGNVSRYDYEGQEYDSAIGAYDFHFRMQGIAGTPPFWQPDTLIQRRYDPQELNRYNFERSNPYKNTDPTGHLVVGYQGSAEGAFGSGFGYSRGEIWDLRADGTYAHYEFKTTSFGGGIGGSAGGEGIFGPKTTAEDFGGEGYTYQGGITDIAGVGPGFIWSGNTPMDKKGRPLLSKSYGTFGYGVVASIGGLQVYGGQTTTQLKVVSSGYWNPFKATISSDNSKSQSSKSSIQDYRASSWNKIVEKLKATFKRSSKTSKR